MKRIAIFSDNLRVGGIQKSLANLLKSNAFREWEVHVFLYDREMFFDLGDPGTRVKLHFLPPMPVWCKALPFGLIYRFFSLPREIPDLEYDLAIDFDSYQNATALGALKVKAKKRVMWIHNDVAIKRREEKKYDLLFRIMKGKYQYFDEFAAVSPGIVDSFRKETGVFNAPVTVIPNLIDGAEIRKKSLEACSLSVSSDSFNLVSVGRLCHQKGYDLLLEDFACARKKRRDAVLYLVGDGPDRQRLEAQAASLKIADSVHFLGNLSNPFPVLRQMDAFCLTSRYEGQGMVLWEAKAVGLPLIFPKRLERYNPGLEGCEDVASAIVEAKKGEKCPSDLESYNRAIIDSLRSLVQD